MGVCVVGGVLLTFLSDSLKATFVFASNISTSVSKIWSITAPSSLFLPYNSVKRENSLKYYTPY